MRWLLTELGVGFGMELNAIFLTIMVVIETWAGGIDYTCPGNKEWGKTIKSFLFFMKHFLNLLGLRM